MNKGLTTSNKSMAYTLLKLCLQGAAVFVTESMGKGGERCVYDKFDFFFSFLCTQFIQQSFCESVLTVK